MSAYDVITIRDSARGDGVADDAPAFKAAIVGAQAAGAGIITADVGTYKLSSNVTVPSSVVLLIQPGAAFTGTGQLLTSGSGAILDTRPASQTTISASAFGLSTGASASTNSTALANSLTAAQNAGPGAIITLPPGSFNLSQAWAVKNAATAQGIVIRGAGRQVTTLVAPNTSTDIIQCGQTGAEVGDNITIEDLGFSGGRYQLNLNNCLHLNTRRLFFSGGTSAIYMQGQNEGHRHEFLYCSAQTGNAIDLGNANSGTGIALDNPESQKCSWSDIYINGCSGTYAFNHAAGILSGGSQQTSGWTTIRNLRIISHNKHGLRISNSQNVRIENYLTEGIGRAAANTYQDLIIENGSSLIYGDTISLGVDVGNPSVQYYVNCTSIGPVLLKNLSTTATAAGTNDVFSTATYLTIEEALLVGGSATGLGFSGTGNLRFTGINVRDSAANPLFGTGGQSTQQAIATGGTVNINSRVARLLPTGAVTGIIMPAGTFTGQTVIVANDSAFSVTFDVQGTSRVANGVSTVIATNSHKQLVWDTGGLWYSSM